MAMVQPGQEYPVQLGQTFTNSDPDEKLLLFRYDFQPASVQRATAGLLVQSDAGQSYLIPQVGQGEQAAYYDGVLDSRDAAQDSAIDCVAIFDGSQWTLELVSGTVRSKHQRGRPDWIEGLDEAEAVLLGGEDPTAADQPEGGSPDEAVEPSPAAVRQPQRPPSQGEGATAVPPSVGATIDQGLNDALDAHLFGDADEDMEDPPSAGVADAAHTQPTPTQSAAQTAAQHVQPAALPPAQRAQQRTQPAAPPPAQHAQQRTQPASQPPKQRAAPAAAPPLPSEPTPPPQQVHTPGSGMELPEDGAEEGLDGGDGSPWGSFVPEPARHAAAQPAAPAAVVAAGAGPGAGVGVSSDEEGGDFEDEGDEEGGGGYSDDESDGLGVEVF